MDKTAIDAYVFPKLIPTTAGRLDTSIGASTVPFGAGVDDFDLGGILSAGR